MPPDSALLSRYAAAGDEVAFSEFVSRHINPVYSSALRRVGGDAHFAEDVTQQVFFAVAQNAAKLARHPMIAAWLFTTTRNISAQLVRTERRRKARELDVSSRPENRDCASPDTDWPALSRFLDHALDRLNAADRSAILLRFMHHQAYADIGRDLNLSEDAARMRVDRAMHKLRALLARHGINSSAAAIATAITAHGATSAPAGLATAVATSAIAGAKILAGAAPAGLLAFFTTSKLAWFAGGLAVLSALGYSALTAFRSHRADQATIALAALDRDHLMADRRALEARARAAETTAETRLLELAAHLDPDSSASDGTNPPSARPGTSLPPSAAPETKQILDAIIKAEHIDPELLRLRLEDIRTRLPLRYGPLLTLLQLSPAQVGTFEALMLRRAEASFGLMVEKFTHDYTDDSSEFLAVKERVHRETIAPINDSLRALLGADGYARFAEYEKLAPARPFVDALAAALYFTNQPLTTAQSVELATALAGSANGAPDWKNLGAPAAISRLQTILSPAQLATFELLCRQSDGQRKMAERRDQLRSRVIDEAVAAGSGK